MRLERHKSPHRSKKLENFETNNKTIAFNIYFLPNNSDGLEKIGQAYISKYSSESEYQVILVMITDGEKWHYLAVKSLSRLSHVNKMITIVWIASAHLEWKVTLNHMRMLCKIHKYCDKILNFTQNHKSMKMPFVIFADTKSLLDKIQGCENDPTKYFRYTL